MDADDEPLLLAVLNTTPVLPSGRLDELQGDAGLAWLEARDAVASVPERDALIEARDLLQVAVRQYPDTAALAHFLMGVAAVPVFEQGTLAWKRLWPLGRELAARVVLAWTLIETERPDRLRACANPHCERFLIDRSRSNQARWCSMAACGNRAKARRHYQRTMRREQSEVA